MQHIKDALAKLKDEDDRHWTEGGKPSLKMVVAIAKDATITQEQLDQVAGDMTRKGKEKPAVVSKVEPVEDGKTRLENVKVIAKSAGYYGSKYRSVGETFYFTGVQPSWLEPVEEPKAEKPKKD